MATYKAVMRPTLEYTSSRHWRCTDGEEEESWVEMVIMSYDMILNYDEAYIGEILNCLRFQLVVRIPVYYKISMIHFVYFFLGSDCVHHLYRICWREG